jgi:glycosyltransferase involved in cell wall biosynthesis
MRLLQQYPFIKYFRNEETKGAAYSRNKGVAATDSTFVVLLDADDKIGSGYLFEAEKLLRQGYDVANPEAILFGKVRSRWPVPEKVTLPMQLKKNNVHCCAAFRRSYWEQVGGMDENMIVWEDYDFWIRLVQAGARIGRLNGDHFYYRKHGTSKSGRVEEKKKAAEYIRSKHNGLFAKC